MCYVYAHKLDQHAAGKRQLSSKFRQVAHSLQIILKMALIHVCTKPIYRPPPIYCSASPMLLAIQKVPLVRISVVFKHCAMALCSKCMCM
jgi:hypothetical protein